MTTALKLITGWILFVTLSHWRVKTDWLEVIVTLLMLAAFVVLVCGTLFSFLAWVLNSNEKDARKAGIKVGALCFALTFSGCAASDALGLTEEKTLPWVLRKEREREAQSWGSTNPTNSPICR